MARAHGQRTPAGSRFRPRYRRISAAGGALAITLVAVMGGLGVLPTGEDAPALAADHVAPSRGAITLSGATAAEPPSPTSASRRATPSDSARTAPAPLPAGSGTGRRVVFDISAQQVWLVDAPAGKDVVRRSYPVSGSVTDNLPPGSYQVYSRSRHAIGIDDSGTMEYMVRFAHGAHAAIGFHDIPVKDGALVQTRAQLGTPQSHGCIRQWRPDAKALWAFAPVGTSVVVVA